MISAQEKNSQGATFSPHDGMVGIKWLLSANKIFFVLACVCFSLPWLFDATEKTNIVGTALLVLSMLVCLGWYWYVKGELTTERVLLLIFMGGFILRLTYVLYTPITSRQHDVGKFGDGSAWGGKGGHSGYIEWFFFNKFKLIDRDPRKLWQFYHPPLHHFVASIWMHIFTHLGVAYERATANIQFLTLFYSACCMPVAEQIFRRIGLKKCGLVFACALVAFHPTFILLSGSINNDMLSILLIFLAIYGTICWYQNPVLSNIIGIALAVGLGMMTKLSVALVAPPIALVFLVKFVSGGKIQWHYLKQFIPFGVVCVPLGMWYGVRNFLKYKVPLTYVPRLGMSIKNKQFIGNYSIFERLFDFSKHPISNVFINWVRKDATNFAEYNPFVAILKSSCFGEYTFSRITPLCRVLLYLNMGMAVLMICTTVYCLFRKNAYLNRTMKCFTGGYLVLLLANYFVFCFQYPHTCSMDFRYIVPVILIGALFYGILMEENGNSIKVGHIERLFLYALLPVLFMVFSAEVYLMLGF